MARDRDSRHLEWRVESGEECSSVKWLDMQLVWSRVESVESVERRKSRCLPRRDARLGRNEAIQLHSVYHCSNNTIARGCP